MNTPVIFPVTQTPSPSPTLTSTRSLTSTAPALSLTPSITPTPTVPQITSEPVLIETIQYLDVPTQTLAEVQYDFVFVSQGTAYRWDHSENQVAPLLEDAEYSQGGVVALAADSDQNSILLHREKGIAANGVELYDLLLYSYESGDLRSVLREIARLYTLRISPDGRWISYFNQVDGGVVYVLDLEGDMEPRKIGECGANEGGMCGGLAWSPNSGSLIWADELGIWGYSFTQQVLNKIIDPEVEIRDNQGITSTVQVHFSNPVWSPFGRYILANVRPDRSQVSWLDIIDLRTGRAAEIPGTFQIERPSTQGAWLKDGRLVILNQSDLATGFQLSVFEPRPTRAGLLMQADVELDFSSFFDDLLEPESIQFTNPVAISDRYLTLRYFPAETGSETGLILIDLEFGIGERLTTIPQDTIDIAWSPDGAHAILLSKRGGTFILDRERKQLYNLQEILPESSEQILWIETKRFVGAS